MSEPKVLLNRLLHERVAVRKPSSLRLHHFERRDKAGQRSPDRVVSNSGQDRDGTPKGHSIGEVYGGFPSMIEEHIPVPRGAGVSRRSKSDRG